MTYTNQDKKRDEKLLDIQANASISEIKKAYKSKARSIHPDNSKKDRFTAEEEFKELHKAYGNLIQNKENEFSRKINEHNNERATMENIHLRFNIDFQKFFSEIDEFLFGTSVNAFYKELTLKRRNVFSEDTCKSGHLPTTICMVCKQ